MDLWAARKDSSGKEEDANCITDTGKLAEPISLEKLWNFATKFESLVAMYPMYGVSKPFSGTCYGHGNIPLRVEGSLDLARRCIVVSPLLFSLVWPASPNKPKHL